MTKERRLAIEMWQEIVNKCKSGEHFNVVSFKKSFCKKHRLHWYNNCYLCQYFECFSTCPLDNCSSLYDEVRDKNDITSAKLILNALKGVKNEI